jgi:hypothetical protein
LWDLPYWADLKLRNNLDVMHIEKNIYGNLLGTFLNIEGNRKDTINSRLDLDDMGIREYLHRGLLKMKIHLNCQKHVYNDERRKEHIL